MYRRAWLGGTCVLGVLGAHCGMLAYAAVAQPQERGVRTRANARKQAVEEEGDTVPPPPPPSSDVQHTDTSGRDQQLAGVLRGFQQQIDGMQASLAAQFQQQSGFLQQQNRSLLQQISELKRERERAFQACREYGDPRMQFLEDLATEIEREPGRAWPEITRRVNAVVYKADVPTEITSVAMGAALDIMLRLSDEELRKCRNRDLVQKLETKLASRRYKL